LEFCHKGFAVNIVQTLEGLTTPHLADACLLIGVQPRCAPFSIASRMGDGVVQGCVRAVRHIGAMTAILGALEEASPGDVLVIDNEGRLDEACVGDLVALRAKVAGVVGIILWGLHRDTSELQEIGLPIFSLGAIPTRSLSSASRAVEVRPVRMGTWEVVSGDVVVADDSGILFLPADRLEEIAAAALTVCEKEKAQRQSILSLSQGGLSATG
jgi:4-hydroxy-4-methyl-2-oxoglutarate aldolase